MSSKIYTAQEMRETAKLYESMAKDIADIIEEKRSEAQYIRENNDTLIGRMDALKLEEEADRIEAAAKRERESGAEAAQICGNMGEQIDYRLGSSEETVYALRYERCLAHNISECARAALSAPSRNCDRFSNLNDALEAFAKERGKIMISFILWLFAEAKVETD